MRVVAGDFGGRRLRAPAGRDTRPTSDRVREAMFSILGSVEGRNVIDVFGGSGALAIEALSRGAARATIVERAPRAVACIRANVADLGLQDRVRVVARDWRAALAAERRAGRWYGVCLVDPPYSMVTDIMRTLPAAVGEVLHPGAVVAIECATRTAPVPLEPLGIASRTDRAYGDTTVCVARLVGEHHG